MSHRPRTSGTCLALLRQELHNGLAFVALAQEAGGDPAARERHLENAETAYSTALRLVATVLMSEAEMREIMDDLRRLGDALEQAFPGVPSGARPRSLSG